MNRFAELIKSVSAAPSVIVHLGAGTCSEHDFYKTISSGQIIYVEPDQHLAEAATDTFNNTPHVNVIPYAIAAENGQRTLNITNNRRFSSLLPLGELLDFYPNIEVDDKVEVEALTLTQLCQDEEISKDSDNLLVAELQGMEEDVFPSAEVDTLQKFKWIIIRSSAIKLYTRVSENAQRSLQAMMQDAGFTVLTFEEDAPPFVNILCIRNDAVIDNIQLTAHETNLVDTIRVLEHNLSKQLANLDDLQTSHAKTMTELQVSLNSKSGELVQANEQIQSFSVKKDDLRQQIKELFSAIDNRSDELAQAHQQIQSFSVEKDDLQQQVRELSSTVDGKSDELDKAHEQFQSFSEEKDDLRQQIKKLEDSISQKENELTEMQQTLKINNKLTLKSDMDLRDLQVQYRTALQHQDQQHMLLSELKEKLRQASAFYQKLNLQNLVIESDMLEQNDPDSDKEHDY